MGAIRSMPCSACPYRRDVPSGVWSADDYAKLPPYDRPTLDQPVQAFPCHATSEHLCHGWAVCHSGRGHDRELLALRFVAVLSGADPEIPEATVPLFDSGTEAAEHGLRDVNHPSSEARLTMARLQGKYERLR